ncbi:carbonic anhydrase [Streptomyces scopuliridis]|uniref:Carbonic anhydrase n=1 Tax=Streptomyces scopuliridis RB72 TaxID=1440053 RepID=A0A2T7SZ08_9ACTN|nr:carbonic anhydrase [Streptomyces scopuliridis]PVE08137.1 carbonic anhydrase [Streptomyces scopuliridis RB72]
MKSLIDNARSFSVQVAERPDEFRDLAAGQTPQALFITCSDSRVIPSLITGARPGELFELRTAGNIVPRYDADRPSGETATIEYALRVLDVRDLVVCGHSHCGAVGAMVRGEDLSAVPAVRGWLGLGASELPSGHGLAHAVQHHAAAQLDTLRGYPAVRERLAEGRLSLHAWYYEVDTGAISVHRPELGGEFRPL